MLTTWLYALVSVFIVSLVSLIGVTTLSIKAEKLKKIIIYLISFSAGALFADAFLHLLPELAEGGITITISFSILLGIIIFFSLEKIVHWQHCHMPITKTHIHSFAIMNLIGDGFQNFLDGLIIGASYLISIPAGIATTLAVVLHEIPQEIGDFGVLIHGGYTKRKAIMLNFLSGINNDNNIISLYNNFNIIQDLTLNISDNANDNRTHQRVPDATGNFSFLSATKGLPNQLTNISNKNISSQCIFETDNVTLSAHVSSFCISKVIFSIKINNSITNLTSDNNIGQTYFRTLNSSYIHGSHRINWTVFALDCFNRTVQDGEESFYVNARTKLSVNPAAPNGINGWYVTEPTFTLSSDPQALSTFYRWDGLGPFNYTAPFKLENSPNQGNTTGGVLELKFRSNFSCSLETEKSRLFRFDFQKPLIKNLIPSNNSITNNAFPTIEALIDEKYQSNSGVDKQTVKLFIDGSQVPITLIDSGSLDVIVRHNPLNPLPDGNHTIKINVSDNAGRFSQLTWFFKIDTTLKNFTLNVSSPIAKNYSSRRIPIEITTTDIVDRIELIDNLVANPRPRVLCRNCDEYGISRERLFTFHEGWNNITIRAEDEFGNSKMKNILFFIDSRPPRISQTLPRRNSVINGSFFQVKYTEDNLKSVLLSFNPDISLTNCQSGSNKVCNISVNLSAFDGQFIDFKFILSDGINTAESRETRVLVDTTTPIIKINFPLNNSQNERRVQLNISVSEQVSLEYLDDFAFAPRMRRLCTNCIEYGEFRQKFTSLKPGQHNLIIKATDKAGNSQEKQVEFDVD